MVLRMVKKIKIKKKKHHVILLIWKNNRSFVIYCKIFYGKQIHFITYDLCMDDHLHDSFI